jgi:hypothetical protein
MAELASLEGSAPHLRRFNYDVTNTVDVSDIGSVRDATQLLFADLWPGAELDELWLGFHDFQRLFEGRMPGYRGCDTVYHDIQHSLDVTLATARLIAGHEKSVTETERLGADRATLVVICALFHDSGYILETGDNSRRNGAEYTRSHITRSGRFLRRYLPRIGMARAARVAAEMLHFTGYEKALDALELPDPLDYAAGHLLGTADLIAQMADRCYLEKCRDRLYPEFVLGGIAIETAPNGPLKVRYQSGTDLLLQTPGFYQDVVKKRLDGDFNKVYRFIEALYAGRNPYLSFIERNMAYLEHVIETGEWPALRRTPPCFTVERRPMATTNLLVNQRIMHLRKQSAELRIEGPA